MEFDNEYQVILAKVVSDNPKAPKLRISTEIGGQKYSTGLWPMTRKDESIVKDKNGNTLYKGKLEIDDYDGGQKAAPPAQDAPFDDDIPFS